VRLVAGETQFAVVSTYSLFIAPLFTNALVLLRVPLIRRLRCGSWISPNRFLLRRFWRHC